MQLYSTNNHDLRVNLKQAVFQGLPADNGLFMPEHIPTLPRHFIENLPEHSFQEIGYTITKALFQDAVPERELRKIIDEAVNFPAPLVKLDDRKYILELFHGPSLAFKDFGARFMARLMSYFNRDEDRELTILVATSGDTGGAVAAGFHRTPGINVVILYPSGKVSALQEKQLTTLGHNITALEVDGTFDDCQALVKKAFLDEDLRRRIRISSANSINISRLVPQSFYYFEAYKQLSNRNQDVVFCVPSGNFGNLTAGLLAREMGLPVSRFIAATNVNDIVPSYLATGNYTPKPSVRTLSNAMDVGNPSNFARMLDLFSLAKGKGIPTDQSIWQDMSDLITGFAFDDPRTEEAILEVHESYNYILDPHGAVGYLALKKHQEQHPSTAGIILETAHPAKFREEMDRILPTPIPIPERLSELTNRKKAAISTPNEYSHFKKFLLDTLE